MYIIQLEKTSYLKENNYPNCEDILLYKEQLIDIYEDGSIIGYGYTSVDDLDEKEFNDKLNEIHTILQELGCNIDKHNNIYFTKNFCVNYGKKYLLALKEKFKNLTPEEFCLEQTKKELDKLKNNFLPLNNVEIYSDGLNIGVVDFMELIRTTLSNGDNISYKIIQIYYGY